jgi:hypothetical protein
MLNPVSEAPGGHSFWIVRIEVDLTGGRPPVGDEDVEPLVELLGRTDGVRSVAVVPLGTGMTVAMGLDAPNATAALERAQALTASGARYAGLGQIAVRRAWVTSEPRPATT